MTKTTTTAKSKTIRMPGKERPAASRLGIQGPPTPEPHPRNTGRNTKPSDSQPTGPTAEGLDYRFFGANPVSSDMDHSARRDPDRAKPPYQTRLRGLKS
jgi:hypothetical protein